MEVQLVAVCCQPGAGSEAGVVINLWHFIKVNIPHNNHPSHTIHPRYYRILYFNISDRIIFNQNNNVCLLITRLPYCRGSPQWSDLYKYAGQAFGKNIQLMKRLVLISGGSVETSSSVRLVTNWTLLIFAIMLAHNLSGLTRVIRIFTAWWLGR